MGVDGDGTLDITYRAVVGAVDDFFGLRQHPLQVVDTKSVWKFWVVDTASTYQTSQVPTVFHFIWLSTEWEKAQPPLPDKVLNRIFEWKRLHPQWYAVIWTNALAERH